MMYNYLMLPYVVFDHFSLGPLNIQVASFFISLAFLIGLVISFKEAARKKVDRDLIINLFFIILLGSLIGAKLGYVLQSPTNFFKNPLIIFWPVGGMAIYGGLVGALLFSRFYLRWKKENFLSVFDVWASASALGIFIGRLGCILVNDHQGITTKLPWGILWPDGVIRHPIAIYLALHGLLIFFILWAWRKKMTADGQLFHLFISLYAAGIFILDFLRVDPHYGGLSLNQWISMILLVVALTKLKTEK